MIRIVKPREKLPPESLVGKYVLREANSLYASLSAPRYVTSASGKRIYVDRERTKWFEGEHGLIHLLDGTGEREPDGYWSATSVTCVCDTFEDVNEVLRERRRIEEAYNAFVRDCKARIAGLDGREGMPTTEAAGKPSP